MKYILFLILSCVSIMAQLRVPTSGLGFPNTSTAPTKPGVCQLTNSNNYFQCYGYDNVLHTFADTNYIPSQLNSSSSACIGSSSCPTACGSANSCTATYVNTQTGTPTSGQDYCYESTYGKYCSYNGSNEKYIGYVPTIFSNLPTCNSGAEGSQGPVTDSTTNTWGATITGGAGDHVYAYCDGSAWTVMGK